MPLKQTIERARRDRRQGKSPSTQAGEFVREQIDKIPQGRHGARSTKQAIAIGLSEARRLGVKLPPPRGFRRRTKPGVPEGPRTGERPRRKPPEHERGIGTVREDEGREANFRSSGATFVPDRRCELIQSRTGE